MLVIEKSSNVRAAPHLIANTSPTNMRKYTMAQKGNGKAAKAKSADAKTTRTRINPDFKIKLLVAENPHKEGQILFGKFALYTDGMTVGEAQEAGITARYIRYHEQRGHVSLST